MPSFVKGIRIEHRRAEDGNVFECGTAEVQQGDPRVTADLLNLTREGICCNPDREIRVGRERIDNPGLGLPVSPNRDESGVAGLLHDVLCRGNHLRSRWRIALRELGEQGSGGAQDEQQRSTCLLYTSDAADE